MLGACIAEEGFTYGHHRCVRKLLRRILHDVLAFADRFELPELTAGLGKVWETLNVSLKFYSCVFRGHTALDAIRELQAEHPFGADDIKNIVVHSSRVSADHVGWKY